MAPADPMGDVRGLEYRIPLETGEEVDVLELDSELCEELRDPEVRAAAVGALRHCVFADRRTIEDAKSGWAAPLQERLRTPPLGCLMSMSTPVCRLIDECGIADRGRCTARNVDRRRRRGLMPVCWEFPVDPSLPVKVRRDARDLATRIVKAWAEGRIVIVVSQDVSSISS